VNIPAEGVRKIPGTGTETEFQLFAQPSKTSFPFPLIPPSFLRETVIITDLGYKGATVK